MRASLYYIYYNKYINIANLIQDIKKNNLSANITFLEVNSNCIDLITGPNLVRTSVRASLYYIYYNKYINIANLIYIYIM